MVKAYSEEIVYTRSEDGYFLEGVAISPTGPTRDVAVVAVHGHTGTFYRPSLVLSGRALAERGYACISGNNRGHDFGTVLSDQQGRNRLGGAAWEAFGESPMDLGAWLSYAEGLGYSQLALMGRSLGALKVAYYQAKRQDPRVMALIAVSPPLRAGVTKLEIAERARSMVAEGRGQELMPWGTFRAGAGTLSAQTQAEHTDLNLDVYGDHTPNPLVASIRCPILATLGTEETWVGTASDLETIRRNATSAARVDTRLFEGADHNYVGHEAALGTAIADWLDSLGAG